jgi:hypothetical protein
VTSTVCLQYTDSKVQTHMLTSLRRILDITQTLADPSDFDRLRLENDERQKQRDAEARNQSLERAWRAALLEWLVFAEIEDRRRRIPEAHKNTLRWVLEDDDDETGFASWAKDGNGIFWVKGKPASGKSTLMKYIADHERLEQLLRAWTGTTPLAIASFWFWAAGSTLQRSTVGLFRTLLHQILKAEESACRVAFPDWEAKFAASQPSAETLSAAMKNVLADGVLNTNFFFIIDGLDEYEADSIGKRQLADFIGGMTASKRVKVVLASRPEAPFESVFGVGLRCPTLRLEVLTKSDISSYVAARLWKNPSLRQFSGIEEDSAYDIENYVIDNAKGVFLWVTLVMDIVIDGIDHHDDFQTIKQRITALPPDLDDLFSHILLRRISDHHRVETFRCLFMVLEWHRSHSAKQLPLTAVDVGQQATSYEKACSLAAVSGEGVRRKILNAENRLRARCHGLLESHHVIMDGSSSTVTFLHRTLLDYLHQHEWVIEMFRKHAGAEFDVFTAIMAGLIAYLQSRDLAKWAGTDLVSHAMDDIVHFNTKAEQSTGQPRSELLEIAEERTAGSSPGSGQQHEASVGVKGPSMGLLAKTINAGAALFLQENIKQYSDRSREIFFPLLEHAVSPSNEAGPNMAAITLLLELGADPTSPDDSSNPWSKTLKKLIQSTRRKHLSSQAMIVQHLDTLKLLAEYTPDPERCRTIAVDDSNASLVIRGSILARRCCSGKPLEDCSCAKSRALKPHAVAVLQLIEARGGGKSSFGSRYSLWSHRKFRLK